MTITKKTKHSKLQIRLENGLDAKGVKVYKTLTYNRIAEDATDAAVQTVGEAIGSLQALPVAEILRVSEDALGNQ